MPWRFLHIGSEAEPIAYRGVNLWASTWKTTGEAPVPANHPSWPTQTHELNRYFVESGQGAIEFAAGEVSPGVWLFYVPERGLRGARLVGHAAGYVSGVAGLYMLFRGGERYPWSVAAGVALIAAGLLLIWLLRPSVARE